MILYILRIDQNTFRALDVGQEIWSVTPSPMVIYDKLENDDGCFLVFTSYVAGAQQIELPTAD